MFPSRRIKQLAFPLGGALLAAITLVGAYTYFRHNDARRAGKRFVRAVYGHRIDDAKAMMDPDDLERLPEAYWDEMATRRFNENGVFSFTGTYFPVLINEFPFWLDIEVEFDAAHSNNWIRDDRVLYVAKGRVIHIATTEFDEGADQ